LPPKRTPFLTNPTNTRNSTPHTDFATEHTDFANSNGRTRKTPRELQPKHLPSRGSSFPSSRCRNTDRPGPKPETGLGFRSCGSTETRRVRTPANRSSCPTRTRDPSKAPSVSGSARQPDHAARRPHNTPPHGGRLPWSVGGEPSLADRFPGRRAPTSNVSNIGIRNVRARFRRRKPAGFLVFATVLQVFAICHGDPLTSAS